MVTSIILYIVPAGRVAYWSSWKLWGLSKEAWGAVHTNLGFLLLLTLILHVFYNWSPMLSYLKNRSRQLRIFTPNFNISLAVTLVVVFGTLSGIPPFSSIINLSVSIKDGANKFYGEPPYGHAELSPLASFAEKVKIDIEEGLSRLKDAGIVVESSNQTLIQIAQLNHISPNQIYLTMKVAESLPVKGMPEDAPAGTGNQILADLCQTFELDGHLIVQELRNRKLLIEIDQTLKENAITNNIGPHELYALIREISLQ
jgi:hypothetical protein